MKQLDKEVVKQLNHILEYLHDSYKGYYESYNDLTEINLKKKFAIIAQKRQDMIKQISYFLISNQEIPVTNGTLACALYRIFIDIKTFVTNNDTQAIIKEMLRGENILIKEYQTILTDMDNLQTKDILQTQLYSIEADLSIWKILA